MRRQIDAICAIEHALVRMAPHVAYPERPCQLRILELEYDLAADRIEIHDANGKISVRQMSSTVGFTVSGGISAFARGILPSGHMGYVFLLGLANAVAQHNAAEINTVFMTKHYSRLAIPTISRLTAGIRHLRHWRNPFSSDRQSQCQAASSSSMRHA